MLPAQSGLLSTTSMRFDLLSPPPFGYEHPPQLGHPCDPSRPRLRAMTLRVRILTPHRTASIDPIVVAAARLGLMLGLGSLPVATSLTSQVHRYLHLSPNGHSLRGCGVAIEAVVGAGGAGMGLDKMKRRVTLTWKHRAPHRINAVSAAHRRQGTEHIDINVHKNQRQICLITAADACSISVSSPKGNSLW